MISAAMLALAAQVSAAPSPPSPYQLVWSDEFNGTRIDRSKWGFDVNCWGGGNAERQCYTDTPRNASVSGGLLTITARREKTSGFALPHDQRGGADGRRQTTKPFTSARMVTRGKAAWRYGKIEIRARLPLGQGTWPALWMLPEDNRYGAWPRSGEIDLMEAVNLGVPCRACASGREDHVLGTIHFGDRPPGNRFLSTNTTLPGAIDGFHVYSFEWTATTMQWSIDGRVYANRMIGEWSTPASRDKHAPFDTPFHLIMNLAIGGHLAEDRNAKGVDPTGFPKRMDIDWVRVWQRPGA